MNEPVGRARGPMAVEDDEAEVAALLREAGSRAGFERHESEAIEAAARSAWQRKVAEQRRRRIRATVGWSALAAAALVAVAVGVLPRASVTAPPPTATTVAALELARGELSVVGPEGVSRSLAPGARIAAGARLATGSGAVAALRLGGGASLRIDAESRLRVASGVLVELERGAVYVDSGHAGAAVEIATVYGRVREIGTQFEVRLAASPSRPLQVRVREGRVELFDPGPLGRLVEARAGEELARAQDGSVQRSTIDRFGDAWGWVLAAAPALEIEGSSLAEFLDWVERETGRRVELGEGLEAAAPGILLHGSVAGLTPEEAVSVVLPGSGLRFEWRDDRLVVDRDAATPR